MIRRVACLVPVPLEGRLGTAPFDRQREQPAEQVRFQYYFEHDGGISPQTIGAAAQFRIESIKIRHLSRRAVALVVFQHKLGALGVERDPRSLEELGARLPARCRGGILREVDERLTDRSRLVITNAREAAREYNHNFIGTEHILLGLLRTPGIAAELLQSLGITPKSVDAKVLEIVGSGEMTGPPMPPNAEAPFTPRGKRVIDLALREALSLGIVGEKNVDAEHILLALIRENQGIAARIMLESGARYRTIRKKLLHSPSPGVVVPEPADVAPVGASIRIGPTPEMRRVWETAAASALEEERLEISAEDLLLALTRDTTTAQLLADLGVDEAAVRRAIKRRQG